MVRRVEERDPTDGARAACHADTRQPDHPARHADHAGTTGHDGTGRPGAGNPGAGNPGPDSPPAGESPRNSEDEPAMPPPAGWQIPEDPAAGIVPDLEPFLAFAQALRDLIPPELQRRLLAALRELLLALRALIDWYLERLERRREQSVEVQDIPIL